MKLLDASLQVGVPIDNIAEWCRINGVNQRTFFRHRRRVAAEGAWSERSRRPHRSPTATADWLVERIVALRTELAPDNGADNIHAALLEAAGQPVWPAGAAVPARATINRVLGREDLLDRNPRKRPKSSYRSFAYARPRDCFQIDGTEHTLADGTVVVAIDIIDDCTRVWLASHVAPAETSTAAIAAVTSAIDEFGAPGLVLADNGSAFTGGPNRHRLTRPGRFTAAVTATGARLIHSSPYHPQTCGKVERFHQTLKRWLTTRPRARTLRQLQAQLDTFHSYYNSKRPHRALGRRTPIQAYQARPKAIPTGLPLDDTHYRIRHDKIDPSGVFTLRHNSRLHHIGVGRRHAGTDILVLVHELHIRVLTHDGELLRELQLDPAKDYQPQHQT